MPDKRLPPDSARAHHVKAAREMDKGRGSARRLSAAGEPRQPPGREQAPFDAVTGKQGQRCREQRRLVRDMANYKQLYRKYLTLFDFAPVGYLLVDHRGTILEANLTAATLLRTSRSALSGRGLTAFIHPDGQQRVGHEVRCCMAGERHCSTKIEMVAADGHGFMAHLQSQPDGDAADPEDCICLSFVDISIETALNKDLALMNTCLEIAASATGLDPLLDEFAAAIQAYAAFEAVGIRLLRPDGSIPYQVYRGFSRRFYESESPLVLGSDQCMCIEVIAGRTPRDKPFFTAWGSFFTNASSRLLASIPPEALGRTRNVCNAEGYESVALVPVRRGKQIAGLIHVADRRANRLPTNVLSMLENAAQRLGMAIERLDIQKDLDRTVDELHHLSLKLIQAQEDEQRRIAMELHDQTGQDLSVLKLHTIDIHRHLLALAPDMAGKCGKVEAFIDKIIEDVRRLSHGLSPAALDILGLAAAVGAMVADFARHIDWAVTVDVAALDEISDLVAQIAVYRIIQEALHNTYKHAGAGAVAIQARRQDGRLVILIRDDGCGFDRSSPPKGNAGTRGLGLAAMRLRARMIGARFRYASRPGQGTQIHLDLPLVRGKEAP